MIHGALEIGELADIALQFDRSISKIMSLHLGKGIILPMHPEPIEVCKVLQLRDVPLEARSRPTARPRRAAQAVDGREPSPASWFGRRHHSTIATASQWN